MTVLYYKPISLALGAAIIIGGLLFFFRTPKAVILQVPFTSQAPNGNWSRNEDCEETSITMANAYLDGNTENTLSAALAQDAINKLKTWEQVNIGYNRDTGADATTRMAEGAFKIKVKKIVNFRESDLKKELARNHVILLPHNAKLLNSPKYAQGGPDYHMLVIRGYIDDKFIVNDPGTTEGNGNEYTFETLKNAAADWDHVKGQMNPNSKIALVLSK